MDACIRLNKLTLKTEEIVRVNREQWTVKPSRTKRLSAPTDLLNIPQEQQSHVVECDDDESESDTSKVTPAATGPAYICRPDHHQLPHSGIYGILCVAVPKWDSMNPARENAVLSGYCNRYP